MSYSEERYNSINKFIGHFSSVKHFFMNGGCYWFSVILQKQFGGTIYYLPVKNHFVVKICNDYWDASGDIILEEEPIEWSRYKQEDESQAKLINKYCISYLEDKEVT